MDDRSGEGGVEEAFYQERDVFILERFDGFGMDDLCAIIGHFDDLVVVELAEDDGVRELSRVRIHNAFNIFPDRQAFGIEHGGENGGGIIAAFTAKRRAFVIRSGADESLGHDHLCGLEERQDLLVDLLFGVFPVDDGVTEIGIRAEDIPDVDPLVIDPGFGEVGADDRSGQQLANTDDLVIIVIVIFRRLIMEQPFDLREEAVLAAILTPAAVCREILSCERERMPLGRLVYLKVRTAAFLPPPVLL